MIKQVQLKNTCKICGNESSKLTDAQVLGKYKVVYFQCGNCGFIQTEEPYWLEEAYSSAITKLDIGLIWRNLHYSEIIEKIIKLNLNPHAKFIDYGGGYGMFVRLMRDKGFDFYRQDIYCENLFAEYFDISDLAEGQRFEALTTFEVFEHLNEPLPEIEKMLALSDTIIFSTELQPTSHPTPQDWWYYVPETGQHISLYSRTALMNLANRFKLYYYTDNYSLHIFSKEQLIQNPFSERKGPQFRWKSKKQKPIELKSLLMKDFELIKEKLKNKNLD
jgi:hypothetical protein